MKNPGTDRSTYYRVRPYNGNYDNLTQSVMSCSNNRLSFSTVQVANEYTIAVF